MMIKKSHMEGDDEKAFSRYCGYREYSHVKAPAISPRVPVPVTTSAPPKF